MTAVNYQRLSTKPIVFLRLTGLTVVELQRIYSRVKPHREAKIIAQKKCHGSLTQENVIKILADVRRNSRYSSLKKPKSASRITWARRNGIHRK